VCGACGGGAATGGGDLAAYEAALRANQRPTNDADVRFMTGMIPHHAQAVLFSRWADSHGAGRAVRVLCERIVVAQGDEILTMQGWLADQAVPVPDVDPETMRVTMHGMDHDMHMPGMLTDEQLARLDAARGEEFDRLFLTYMIGHHEGALVMVDELFASYGAAQDDLVYKLASDVYADQSTEIERMQGMLDAMQNGARER
jgi:uncharacterized protein (DUF305 family)